MIKYIKKNENLVIQTIILFSGIILFLFKLFAWYFTNSLSILSDALESIINISSSIISLISIYISNIPKDNNHPNGHGKIEFITSGIEGTLILITGFIVIYYSIIKIFISNNIQKLDFGILLIFITSIVNYILGIISINYGKKNNSIVLISGGEHLKTDTYSSIGVIIGLILIYITNYNYLDLIISFCYGSLIIITGYKIIKLSISGIMDESNYDIINKIKKILNNNINYTNNINIKEIKTINYGNLLHIDIIIKINNKKVNIESIIQDIENIKNILQRNFNEEIDLYIQYI